MSGSPNELLDRVRAATSDEYIVEGELGRGGMAAVYLGRDIALDRRVAIKVMLPDMAGVAGSQDRFVVEARTAARLDHPGIVTIYAVKQRAGLTFIVMKYIEGLTLDRVLATRGPLDAGVVATIGSHVAEALHFAHSQGVVHRDVKPSNIIIDTHGRPIVTDFGIAKVTTAPSLTLAGAVVGTPGYMSPEQCRGLAVTPASDQYSLGVMLYELLAGSAPFSGTLFDLLKAHVSDPPPTILALRPDVDPALEAIISIMLAKTEAERFPSLHDVSQALLSLVPRRGLAAEREAIMAAVAPGVAPAPIVITPVPGGGAPAIAEDSVTVQSEIGVPVQPAGVQPADTPRKGRGKTFAGVAIAVLVLALAGYALATRSSHAPAVVQAAAPAPVPAVKVDSVPSTKTADSIAAIKPDSSVIVTKPGSPATNAPASTTRRPASGHDSTVKARPDSIGARCNALNLKFSLGEEMTKADTTFLRRECAKVRSRPPGA